MVYNRIRQFEMGITERKKMMDFAEKFRSKRKELGFSQAVLAEGICEQSQISKIERGNYMPAADLLYKLARRLQVPVEYFFDDHYEVVSHLADFKNLSTKLLEDRNYKELGYLYHLEKEKNSYLSQDDQAYLDWIQAILLFYLHKDKEAAVQQLESLLDTTNEKSHTYLKILNTLANFYSLFGRDEDYEAIHTILMNRYQEMDLGVQEHLFGYIRVRFNYAHYLLDQNQKLNAVKEALETIELCKSKQTSYQLAPLLTLVGNAGLDILEDNEVKSYYLEARDLCKIFDHKLMYLQIESFLKEFEEGNTA